MSSVNPRPGAADFTRYSFPSKTLEYLDAGKPVLAYRNDGIPPEYDEHLLYISDPGPVAMATPSTGSWRCPRPNGMRWGAGPGIRRSGEVGRTADAQGSRPDGGDPMNSLVTTRRPAAAPAPAERCVRRCSWQRCSHSSGSLSRDTSRACRPPVKGSNSCGWCPCRSPSVRGVLAHHRISPGWRRPEGALQHHRRQVSGLPALIAATEGRVSPLMVAPPPTATGSRRWSRSPNSSSVAPRSASPGRGSAGVSPRGGHTGDAPPTTIGAHHRRHAPDRRPAAVIWHGASTR